MPRRDSHGGLTGPPAWITLDPAARTLACACGATEDLSNPRRRRALAAAFVRAHTHLPEVNECPTPPPTA